MEVKGCYYFNLKIGEYSNFIQPGELQSFYMKRNCGAAGILFKCQFYTKDEKIKDLIIENNKVVFEVGATAATTKTYNAYITEHNVTTSRQDDTFAISFYASSINLEFYTTRLSETINGTSLDVVKKMAKDYLETDVDSKLTEVMEDKKNWVRSYETAAVTMLEGWLHMRLPKNDTPLLWIDSNNIVHMRELSTMLKEGPKHRFVPLSTTNVDKEQVYINNFSPTSYKFSTNLIQGEKTIVNISDVESGEEIVHIPDDETKISSTKKDEKGSIGSKTLDNKYQHGNVHAGYHLSYYTNKLNLIRMSAYIGELEILGGANDIEICDLVEVLGSIPAYGGRYIVNTIVTYITGYRPMKSVIHVCRDNMNSIEDSAVTPVSKVKVTNQQMTDILQCLRNLRRLTVMSTKMIDGTIKRDIMAYVKSFKYYALCNFKVMGAQLNLNSSLDIMQSLKNIGNNLLNNIIDKYIPYPYNLLLHNIVQEGLNFNKLLSKLLAEYLPSPLREMLQEIMYLINDLKNLADALHKQNSKSLSDYNYKSGGYATTDGSTGGNASGNNTSGGTNTGNKDMIDYTQENTEKIEEITDEFLENTEGLDIPMPEFNMSESDSLLPKTELKDVMANKLLDYLDGQGYLDGVGKDFFLAILMGKKPLDFNTINRINGNVGNMLYARYWGTYTGEVTKLGTIDNIFNQVVTIPNTEAYNSLGTGDIVVISGTPSQNGQYTVSDLSVDNKNTYVTILEECKPFVDEPLNNYTKLCTCTEIKGKQSIVIGEQTYNNLTAFVLDGRFDKIIQSENIDISSVAIKGSPESDNIYPIVMTTITKPDETTYQAPYCVYDNKAKTTTIYSRKLAVDYKGTMDLQLVIPMDSKTSISKISNQDITDFFIKNGFKDIYSTVPCTKTINALRGAKVWIALPMKEHENIDFYINSKITEMEVIESMDLGLYAAGGAKLYYNIYISPDVYNSNSVTLEVRRKQ